METTYDKEISLDVIEEASEMLRGYVREEFRETVAPTDLYFHYPDVVWTKDGLDVVQRFIVGKVKYSVRLKGDGNFSAIEQA